MVRICNDCEIGRGEPNPGFFFNLYNVRVFNLWTIIMLSPVQAKQFEDDGYLVIEQAVSAGKIEQVRAHVNALRAGRITRPYYANPLGPMFNAHLQEPLLMSLVCTPSIHRALGQLLGAAPGICQSMFFFSGSRTRPHQDEFYMVPRPAPLIGCWIAVQDVTEQDGPLGAIAGSQRGPIVLAKDIQGQWWKDKKVWDSFFDKVALYTDHSRIRALTVKSGDVIFFHGRVIHCGMEPATPDRPRWSFVSHHCRADAVMDDSNNSSPATIHPMIESA